MVGNSGVQLSVSFSMNPSLFKLKYHLSFHWNEYVTFSNNFQRFWSRAVCIYTGNNSWMMSSWYHTDNTISHNLNNGWWVLHSQKHNATKRQVEVKLQTVFKKHSKQHTYTDTYFQTYSRTIQNSTHTLTCISKQT